MAYFKSMQQIQNIIKESIKESINRMEGQLSNNQNQASVFETFEEQNECNVCMQEFSRANHPIKICINDHNMCHDCVQHKLFTQTQKIYCGVQTTIYSCPFCSSKIDFNKLVINFKLLNQIKGKISKEKTQVNPNNSNLNPTNETSLFEKLSEQNYRIIMSFVTQKDKINLSSANLFLRSLLMTDLIWGQFEISDCLSMNIHSSNHQQNWNLRLKGIQKYFSVIKPHEVRIIMRDFYEDSNLISFFLDQYPWVTKLTLFCQSIDVHLAIAKSCLEITFLNVSSSVFSDELFQEMSKHLRNIKHFQVIKDDVNFTAKNISQYFPSGLESILLKPHMVEFEQIALLAKQNPQDLTQIQLDIEDCPEQTLVEILEPLTNVQVLKLYHMENIYIPEKLAQSLSSSLRELYLTKAYEMPVDPIIQKIASPKLLTLDFIEVNMLSDKNLQTIAKESPYLKRLNISWCTKVTQTSVSLLLRSCLSLQYVNLTGLKNLNDQVFEQYAQLLPIFDQGKYDITKHNIAQIMNQGENSESVSYETMSFFKVEQDSSKKQKINQIKSLKNVKQLNCVSCNGISDGILKLIYLINRKANTVNYYGNCMGLYTNEDIFGSY